MTILSSLCCCAPPVLGACCIIGDDGSKSSCLENLGETECFSIGGAYMGQGSDCSGEFPCDPMLGGCRFCGRGLDTWTCPETYEFQITYTGPCFDNQPSVRTIVRPPAPTSGNCFYIEDNPQDFTMVSNGNCGNNDLVISAVSFIRQYGAGIDRALMAFFWNGPAVEQISTVRGCAGHLCIGPAHFEPSQQQGVWIFDIT